MKPCTCKNCKKKFTTRHPKVALYCCNACQQAYQTMRIVKKWKAGEIDGNRGKFFQLSKAVRRYIMEKNGCRCSVCGWSEVNPISGKVPLQVHHIDGNASHTQENNLQVLCPNCHALTPNFGKLNKVGRFLRRKLTDNQNSRANQKRK